MLLDVENNIKKVRPVIQLTKDWGDWHTVSLFLDRCQVDTPDELVKATWRHVKQLRASIGKVVDFGAGDGRFARGGAYQAYVGYEIDEARCQGASLPINAALINRCAFSDDISDADLCIGNPPFVRNQDLPLGWRQRVSEVLKRRTGVSVSGLANAWQYFFLLALASVKEDGLCALVIPFEWVSRPSVQALRDYITAQRWNVAVYRLVDNTFDSVLTTSSITIVDKANRDGNWAYFEETCKGAYLPLKSPSGAEAGMINYSRRRDVSPDAPKAVRGLSPGTQKVLTLTEGERVRNGLEVGRDVVPCITTLRHLPSEIKELDDITFSVYYRNQGQKCWLIRTNECPSAVLQAYLAAVPSSDYQTSTCLKRAEWWKFNMPPIPNVLMSQSFRDTFPKAVKNRINARAVGGVCGIYNVIEGQADRLTNGLDGLNIRDRIVAHSNGLRKIEINQLNTLLNDAFKGTTLNG
jgi:hypothetical protein